MIGLHGFEEAGEESSNSLQDVTLKNGRTDLGIGTFSPRLSPARFSSSEGIITQFAFIKDGICTTCNDAEATQTALACLFCKLEFHAVCRDADKDRTKTDIICPRTFFNSYRNRKKSTGVDSGRFGTFTFVCDVCMTHLEQNSAATNESKVDIIDKRVNDLSQSVESIKELLIKVVDKQNTPERLEKPPPPAPATPVPEKPSYRSVLVMSSKNPEDKDKDCQKVDKIIRENSIHADKRYVNRKGEIVVVCPSATDRENLASKVSQHLPEMQTHQPPDRLPTISVANITEELSEENLQDLILQAHPDIKSLAAEGETFSVLKVKPQIKNREKYQATIRVSNNIRKLIERQRDRLYIGSFSYKVFDQFHVKRCNKCQGFGHYKSECKSDKTACGYCSKNHPSENCTEKAHNNFLPCCTNCKRGKFQDQKLTHTAFDRICPSYIAEQHLLRKTINYYNPKN